MLNRLVYSVVFWERTQTRTLQAAWLILLMTGLQKWLRNGTYPSIAQSRRAKIESAVYLYWAQPDVSGLWPMFSWFILSGEGHAQGHSATERLFLEDWSLPLYSMHMAATFSAVKFKTYAGQNIFTASGCDRPSESYG